MPQYLFTVCQIGAEAALKEEIAQAHPELKFSYSRPGFVTFVNKGERDWGPDFRLRSIFARAYGLSERKSKSTSIIEDLSAFVAAKGFRKKPRLHVFERDLFFPGDEAKGFELGAAARKLDAQLRASGTYEDPAIAPSHGDPVVDVCLVEFVDGKDEIWLGTHTHHSAHSGFSGGRPPITLPPEAPSRAYLKFEEGALRAGAELKAGERALEIGCTPGGTLYALLKRGLQAWGVDHNTPDPKLSKEFKERFTFIQSPMEFVEPTDPRAPRALHWLLMDVNLSPDKTLPQVAHWVRHHKQSLKGAFLTLKLMHWDQRSEIPRWFEKIESMGLHIALARQLAYNRQEFLVYARPKK
jgi:23S rRNA (cytidine2498-2'-O)-methyltransferase